MFKDDLFKILKKRPHPLEDYIIAIDQNLENKGLLKSIGEKIGIDVYNDTDPEVSLYIILKDYLENETDPYETKKKIDTTLTEFSKKYPQLNSEQTFTLYANRLLADKDKRNEMK